MKIFVMILMMRGLVILTVFLINVCFGEIPAGKWHQLQGVDSGDMHFIYSTNDNILFASHGFGGVWRSEDIGKNWQLIEQEDFLDVIFHCMAEKNNILYAGSNKGLWKSYNKGKKWEKIITGIEDIDSGKYSVVSLTIIDNKIFFSTVLEKIYRKPGQPAMSFIYYFEDGEKVKEFFLPSECKYEIVISGKYPYLFSSSLYSGLYVYSFKTNQWEKILDKKTTRVFVDDEYNVYVGTFGNWYFVGEKKNYGWQWHQIKITPEVLLKRPEKFRKLREKTKNKRLPERKMQKKLEISEINPESFFHFILPDPVNKNYLWFGAGGVGGLYSISARGKGISFIGTCFYKDGEIRNINISSRNYSTAIAFIKGEKIRTIFGDITKIAFIPQGGRGCIQKTEDGGKSWIPSYKGIYGVTINKINIIKSGILKDYIVFTAVSGIEIAIENGERWIPGIEFTIGGEKRTRKKDGIPELPGYPWCASSPERKIKGKYDLLISTGYPAPSKGESKGDGVFAFLLSSLKTRHPEKEKIISGPYYEMLILDNTLYAGNMDGGIDVVDLESFRKGKIETVGAGNYIRYYDRNIFIGTYNFKGFGKENIFYPGDLWKAFGREGGIYLFERRTKILKEIFDAYCVNFSIKNSQFIALTPKSIVFKENVYQKDKIEVNLNGIKFCDMAVDWEEGLVFLANYEIEKPGVFLAYLSDIKRGKLKLINFSKGLLTNRVRNLEYENGFLFAGTEGLSVWRIEITH